MGDNSIGNYFTWMAWTFATLFSVGSYRLAHKPSVLSFPVSFLASEYAHVSAAAQVLFILLLGKLNPRLLHTNMGKIFCLANCFATGLQVNLVLHALRSTKIYAKALNAKGVRTPNLDAGAFPMLLSLFSVGSMFLPKEVKSTELSYAAMEDVDQELADLNKTTSRSLKRLLSNTGRGRRAKWLTLDIIERKDRRRSKELLPVLFYVHGGAWTVGDKTFACRPMLEYIAATQDVIVVTINYRLAPERTFPSQLLDAKRALVWVKRNIKEHGGNPAKIVVAGESAGGHLSAMMALTCNNPDYQPEEDPDADTSLVGCVDLYGVHDLRERKLRGISQRVLLQTSFRENPEEFAAGSPTAIVEKLMEQGGENATDPPPILVIHGSRDSLAPLKSAINFFEQLKKLRSIKNSSHKDVLVVQPTAHHAFGYLKTPRTVATALAISDFLKDCANTSKL